MTDTVYAIIFDQLDPSFDPVAFRDALKTSDRVSHWWNHIPNCFLVSSHLNAKQLTDWVRKHTGEVGFLTIETKPSNSEGHLPTRSWKWLRQRELEIASN